METLRIPIHSFVDVITNSSTVIYTYAGDNSVKICHEAVNEILKVAGSEKSQKIFLIFM